MCPRATPFKSYPRSLPLSPPPSHSSHHPLDPFAARRRSHGRSPVAGDGSRPRAEMHPRRSLLPRAGASFFTGECEDGVCGRRGGVLRAGGEGRRNGRRSTSATPRSAESAAAEGRQRGGVYPLVGRRHACQTEGEGAMTMVTTEKEVSPVEDLEKARERRGRMRAPRGVTDRVLREADGALTRDLQDWGAPTTSSAGAELSTMVFHQT